LRGPVAEYERVDTLAAQDGANAVQSDGFVDLSPDAKFVRAGNGPPAGASRRFPRHGKR
jgi:hypothetical protein